MTKRGCFSWRCSASSLVVLLGLLRRELVELRLDPPVELVGVPQEGLDRLLGEGPQGGEERGRVRAEARRRLLDDGVPVGAAGDVGLAEGGLVRAGALDLDLLGAVGREGEAEEPVGLVPQALLHECLERGVVLLREVEASRA